MLSLLPRASRGLLSASSRNFLRGHVSSVGTIARVQNRALSGMEISVDKASGVHERADSVLKFWCGEDYVQQNGSTLTQSRMQLWYGGGEALDLEIKGKFAGDVEAAAAGTYNTWIDTPFNGLALLIILDQFTRNMYRNTPKAYVLDQAAVKFSRAMMASGKDMELTPVQRHWIYTPFQHSESLADQKDSVRLHEDLLKESQESLGDGQCTDFLQHALSYSVGHCKTVEEHGRFPHRDAILGRG